MSALMQVYGTPEEYLRHCRPELPVYFMDPRQLSATLAQFQRGFPGAVTFAAKANPSPRVLMRMLRDGIDGFDVASVPEIRDLRRLSASVPLHYNNPVRSRSEVAQALALGVRSFAVDSLVELDKLPPRPDIEVSVRLKLAVPGAKYDFGSKFGTDPEQAAELLGLVAARGMQPSLTFHVGTQCEHAQAYATYIATAAQVAGDAGVALHRLNVGGGFPARRLGYVPDLPAIFASIEDATRKHFGKDMPKLLCEPGRALVADAFALAVQVKSVREDGSVFLNDGLYGGLSEFMVMDMPRRTEVITPAGRRRRGASRLRRVFGPTCDSVDEIRSGLDLPDTLAEGDYILFHGMGAYVTSLATQFNGYGAFVSATVRDLG